MRPRTQKQPQVKKELCRVLDDVDVDECKTLRSCLIECFTPFKLADPHAYSLMHNKKALPTKAPVQSLQFL